jgi:H+/Cl- antiporter ClcA
MMNFIYKEVAMKSWWFWKASKFLVVALLGAFVLGTVVMVLWNALIPDLFKGPTVTFWQAIGLLVLSHILLRGWGRWRYANGWRHDRWKHRMEEKLAAMTPEEREKYKEEWRRRCGWDPTEQRKESPPQERPV